MPNKSRYDQDDDENDTSHFGADADDDQDDDDDNEEDEDEGEGEGQDDDDQDDDDADRGDNVDGDGDDDGEEGEEGEEDGEGEADPAALRRIADGQDDDYVPRARLNEVLARESKLIDALVTKDGGTKKEDAPPPFDLKAKIKARNAKILEGDEDAAADIDMEIEDYRMGEAEARAEAKVNARLAQQETDRATDEVMKQYPQLNDAKGNKAFDPEVLEEVITLRNGYIASGMSVAEALRKSAKRLCKPGDTSGDAARDPKRDAAGDGKGKNGRDPKAVRRVADAVRRTPPRPNSAGIGERGRGASKDLNPETMSEGRFADLSEDEMKKMRGDEL